jgi:hypothetical protein
MSLLVRAFSLAVDTARPAPIEPAALFSTPDPALEALFARNVASISAINRQRGVRTFWVGQLVNVHELAGDEMPRWTIHIRGKHVWALLERLNRQLQAEAGRLGDTYIDVPVGTFDSMDFVDSGHFSAAGAARFAGYLAGPLRACEDLAKKR